MRARLLLIAAAIVVAGLLTGLGALSLTTQERDLTVGRIQLSVDPFHRGALDVYVPVVDWGLRFPGVRLPARLRVEVRAIDREAAAAVASGSPSQTHAVRAQARDAIAGYLRRLALVTALAAVVGALIVAAMLRAPRRLLALALVPAVAWAGAVAFLLAPRGDLASPEYYAHGPDIPIALRAVQAATRSSRSLGDAVEGQLVGLARLVAPGQRRELDGLPRVAVASDLHNNVLAISALARAADHAPVLFPGDLTDSGTPLEGSVLREVAHVGHPFVFTGGNHDSDTLERSLARQGAIVLTRDGRLLPNGRHGPMVVTVDGLRVAGYASPNERRAANGFRDRGADVSPADQQAFARWLDTVVDRVDVVLVHEPDLAAPALAALRERRLDHRLLVVSGHTHVQDVASVGGITEVNAGTLGAGGTGNLGEGQDIGLAIVTLRAKPFDPLAVDLVQIDPGDGSATAKRVRVGSARASG